jgi:hypothetical protein
MKLMVCVPDFANSLLATYQCPDCSLLDRIQMIDGETEAMIAPDSSGIRQAQNRFRGGVVIGAWGMGPVMEAAPSYRTALIGLLLASPHRGSELLRRSTSH